MLVNSETNQSIAYSNELLSDVTGKHKILDTASIVDGQSFIGITFELCERGLLLDVDGSSDLYSWSWLADVCGCTECNAAGGKQATRQVKDTSLIRLTPVKAAVTSTDITIVWAHHVSTIPLSLIVDAHNQALLQPVKFSSIYDSDEIPSFDFSEVMTLENALGEFLGAVDKYGAALTHNVGTDEDSYLKLVNRFGFIRETNYGKSFDVILDPTMTNLAFTDQALFVHTDNPYRDPVPTLQLLHCLVAGDQGGQSIIVDGFKVAQQLREEEPRYFDLLSTYPIRWQYCDQFADLEFQGKVIERDYQGDVIGVRFNERSRTPVILPGHIRNTYLDALAYFRDMLASPKWQICFKLEAGQLILFNNRRVLHGRTQYANSSHRHLKGAYADIDSLRSTLTRIASATKV